MKNHKIWNILGFVLVILAILAGTYVSAVGVGEKHQGSAQNIKLGLDLAGGVSITYEANESNPSAEDMRDTVYKLQQRVGVYSTEAEVYQEGSNRINVEIPGVYNAEEVLETLGNPGTIQFYEASSDSDSGMNLVLDGNDVVNAQVVTEPNEFGNNEYVVRLTFSSEGAQKFEEATARNIDKPIYIVYDGQIISAPQVNQTISGGNCVITGNFTYDQANSLATSIRLGVLKLTLTEVQSSVVGARLGEDAVGTSLLAAAIGFVIVVIFMIAFYRIQGLASGIALALYLVMMLCFLNALDVTLTLPGIAGIILSIGMAVDANVIIFTRVKEEIAKGHTVQSAMKLGYHKALSAILDGNITTLIAAAVLYIMGTGSIKGFATTLALGIVLSMITALFVTRIVMNGFYVMGITDEKFYGRQKEHKPFNFTGHKAIFYLISVIVIGAGLLTMGINGAGSGSTLNYSLDFTGGTSMTVTLDSYVDVTGDGGTALREMIEETTGITDIQLQNVQESNDVVIKTPVLDQSQRTALKEALAQDYGVEDGEITESNISGVVSSEMRRNAVISVVISGILMLIYIWIRFKDFKIGASAVIALFHDVLVVLAVYAVVRIPVGNTFIACMLTIVGYSINATIVIFDRIRENRTLMEGASLEEITNVSITQTFSRSINTSFTTFIMVFMLFVLGVSSIREFALPLMAGIIAGAFSSVCISGTLWCIMKNRGKKEI
ncbi:MAG TPA: protein translocase subunit SecD [Candidatus Scybalocola faecigallinarum]|uniref:Multifunctional fusion protein n=1 Tax=Candidatus Scybalocola faecigallinarum TaxID=2840941 RepID=A0A9D1F5F2_9FIRM|nr:protein translocase subunit SecD [Candidatus Scybalocola faecigallinarum]